MRAGEFTGHGLVAVLLARGVVLTGVLARVTRQCDTVQTPIVREHLLVHVSMKSVRSLGINQFYPSTCVHLPYPQRAQTMPITALPQPYLITVSNEISHVWTQYLHGVSDNALLAQLMLNRIRQTMARPTLLYYFQIVQQSLA